MSHRKRILVNHLDQFKFTIQSIGNDAVRNGDKMLLARIAFILQLIRDVEFQVEELKKEIPHG